MLLLCFVNEYVGHMHAVMAELLEFGVRCPLIPRYARNVHHSFSSEDHSMWVF